MGAFRDALKTVKLWQMGVLAAVLVGVAGTTYGMYALLGGSNQDGLGENQQLIPVQYGNLVNQVSTSGSLLFANRATLTFGTQGIIGEVLVVEGQQVEEGQELVRLDQTTASSLDKAVAQARVSLRNAEDALAKAQNPHTALEMAQAETAVANARLSLKKAREALDDVKNGSTADEVAKAQSQVDSAMISLANVEGDLALTQKEWDSKVLTAQDTLDTALMGYRGVFSKWLGIGLDEREIDLDPDTLLDTWGIDLASLFDPSLRFQDIYKWLWAEGPPPDDPTTPWNEFTIYTWLNLFPGAVVATCDTGTIPAQRASTDTAVLLRGACVKKEMDDAWDASQKAQDNLDAVETQAAKAIASADTAAVHAKDSLTTVEEALADLQSGPDTLEVDVKEKQLAVSQASLAKAEEDLAELQGSADALEVALREAELALAQVALETALQRLEGVTLKAPMAGVVSLVNVEAGQTVMANTTIAEVVDPTIVEVDGIVDEIDVLFVSLEARADVTMDALPGQVLQGTVSAIASAAQSQQGVVSYPIRIQVQVPAGVELREGLSATASIVIREELNVLLVPLQALYGTFEQPVVLVMKDGRVEERLVALGSSDDYWAAVRQGLAEGEQVVMETTQAATSQLGMGMGLRQFQGQFSGAMPGGAFMREGGGDVRQARPTPQPRR